MADFCKDCSTKEFGKDYGDLAALCKDGQTIWVICEGCMGQVRPFLILVDHTGRRRREFEEQWLEKQDNGLNENP